jgi:hypothetical protein
MTTNSVQEEQPMIMSTCPVTSGNENDSQVVPVENHSQVLDIDVTPTPQPPVDHYLELEGDDGIRATLVCKSRPGAECRMVHDCACEEYCACEPPSRMVDIGECNHANWINADVYATDQGKAGTRILVPVDTAWNDDRFEWEFVPGITK